MTTKNQKLNVDKLVDFRLNIMKNNFLKDYLLTKIQKKIKIINLHYGQKYYPSQFRESTFLDYIQKVKSDIYYQIKRINYMRQNQDKSMNLFALVSEIFSRNHKKIQKLYQSQDDKSYFVKLQYIYNQIQKVKKIKQIINNKEL